MSRAGWEEILNLLSVSASRPRLHLLLGSAARSYGAHGDYYGLGDATGRERRANIQVSLRSPNKGEPSGRVQEAEHPVCLAPPTKKGRLYTLNDESIISV